MPIVNALGKVWRQGRLIERAGYLIGAALLLSGLVHLSLQLGTAGSWEGPLSLRKPTTFGLSFGLTLINIVWVTSFLEVADRPRTTLLTVFACACVFETALVTLQAWRGVPSHFNLETPFDAMVARLLAGGGFVLVAIIVALTAIAFRTNGSVSLHLRAAIRVGFLALCGSLAIGGLMIARGMVLVFSGQPETAYSTAGSLKPTHAVLMHGILVLPLLASLLSFTRWSDRRRWQAILAASTGYVMLATVVASSNFLGLDPRHVPSGGLALFALGAGALLMTGFLATLELLQTAVQPEPGASRQG